MDKEKISEELKTEVHKYWHKNIKLEPKIILTEEQLMEIAIHFANWQHKMIIRDIIKSGTAKVTPFSVSKRKRKNHRTQFEIISLNKRNLIKDFDWCVNNLPLKEDKNLFYQVSEIYIITSSQIIIDRVNKHFGSSFNFNNSYESRIFYVQ